MAVNRGFVPRTADVETDLERPDGQVRVVGLARATEERGGIGPTDPPTGVLRELARVDLDRIGQQLDAELYPVYIQLLDQTPSLDDPGLPTILPPPERSEGSHLAYAGQWFLFATVGVIGWPVLLRKTWRERALA